MFGPQSPLVFVVLLGMFSGVIYWLARVRKVAWQALAGITAFVPAAAFGVAAVNKYYDYYASWDDVWGDLSDEAPAKSMSISDLTTPGALDRTLARAGHGQAAKHGFLFSSLLPGTKSGISRTGMIFLPPQYFQPRFAKQHFAVLELLHGGPGTPADFTRVLKTPQVLMDLVRVQQAHPVVLVMPDSNGGRDVALQCLDTVNGPQDETYLTQDVPTVISSRLRVLPPGPGWGVAGYSEGGYCAANLGLRHPKSYGVAGVMSGYFEPLALSRLPRRIDPFAGNRSLRTANSPSFLVRHMTAPPPVFWVMAGSGSKRDLTGAQNFINGLRRYQSDISPVVVPGGRHDFKAWRKALPLMISWTTSHLPQPS